MHRIVVSAEVENAEKWEKEFQTHGDLFKTQTVADCHYSVNSNNQVTVCFEAEDLGTFMESMESPATAAAMIHDGIKRETVTITVLDKTYTP